MRKNLSFFKKSQAVVLVLALIVSLAFPLQGMQVTAETNATETITDGKIVANNYELSVAEKELIGSGLLTGRDHTFLVPDSDDGLITVDTDNKKITVGTYEGTSGYLWKAASADIVVGTEVKETVALTNGEGNYTYDGNAFSVVAKFALDIEVDTAIQTTLLNAPKDLSAGLSNLKDIAALKSNIAILEKAMPQMVDLANEGIYLEAYGMQIRVYFKTTEAKGATDALSNQMTANGDKLDLTVMIDEYEAAESKVEYLIKNGAAMKAKAEELRAQMDAIIAENCWSFMDSVEEDDFPAVFILRSALRGLVSDLATIGDKEWLALDKTIVKEGLTDAEYAQIDAKLANITDFTDILSLEIKNPLRVSTADVQFNMSMFDVKVKVALNLTDATSEEVKYYEYGSKTTTVTLAEDATKAEILEAVQQSGIEAEALAAWGSAYVEGKFNAVKSDLPDTLTSDIEYVITYTPNMYNVTFAYGSQGTVAYPYGYVIALENHADELKAYDYTINGQYYAQGSSYKVIDDTEIKRKEGKSYITSNLYQIVANNYLSGKGASILTSGALFGDELVAVRYPDNNKGIVTLTGNQLSAADFAASYNGLSWKPYSYTLSNGNTYQFNGANTVEISEEFSTVTVSYRLYLTNYDNNTVIDIANIPNMLDEEATAQLEAFARIAAQKGNLETLNRTMVNILAGLIENTTLSDDATKDAKLKENFTNVLNSIQSECMGATNLYLFDKVNEYSSSSDKLLYYYNNNEQIRAEIAKLAGYMTDLLGDTGELSADDKLAALEKLMRSLPSNIVSPDKVDEYVAKLTTLETTMNGVKNDLSAPNAVIDLDSANLAALTAAIQSNGNTEKFVTLSDALHLEDSTIMVVASNKTAIKVTLQIEGGKNTTISSDAVFNDVELDAAFVSALKDAIKAELTAQSINAKYYDTTYVDTVFDTLVGKLAGDIDETEYEFVWTYKSFNVSVPGIADQIVNVKNKVIALPASTNADYRYDYYINGVMVNASSYTLSDAEFDMVVNGTFNVTKKEVYIVREALVNYVNSLNQAVADDQAVFALVEDNNGKFSIVLKIDASAPNGLMGAVQGMAMGMVQGAYPYVGINNDEFLADGSVHLQTMIDAILSSGFGSDAMLNMVDRSGNIIDMPALEGNIITNKPMTKMGGKLMETTIQLGTTSSDVANLPFYVTLSAVNDEFVQIRNLFEDKLSSLLSFKCDNGAAAVTLNLPEKVYESFLAVLLVTENLSLDDVNAINGEISATFINDMLIPLFKGDISVKTFDNTLAKFDLNLNLASYKGAEALFAKVKSFYTDATFTYDETSATASGNLGISSFIDSMNLGVLGNIIAEKETGLDINVRIAIKDLEKDYEALYIDTDAAGLTNKIGLTENLAAKLAEIEGKGAIILLKDVADDLTFNKSTLFNLNGHKVDGNISANAKTIIIDSNIKTSMVGTVTGKVSGNATIVAGKYDENVADYVKAGFVQKDDGVVTNKYYSIAQTAEGNINVSLNADVISNIEKPDMAALAIDLACDILFNGYSNNYLELDGYLIYDLSVEDVIGLYTSSNRLDTIIEEGLKFVDSTQLSAFINNLLDDVVNFTAISETIEKGEPILEYQMVTKPWSIEFEHIVEGNYITSNVVAGDKAEDVKLRLYIDGSADSEVYLTDLFAELGKTVDADINLAVSHIKDGSDIKVNAVADAEVLVDWTNPDYAVMYSVIIADGLKATEREDLVNGIRIYYEQGDISALRDAFNNLKVSQAITAIENISLDDSFTNMIKALGLEDVVTSEVIELEKLYDRIGKAVAFIARKANLDGGARTLGSMRETDGSYGITRENIERFFKVALFRGYALEADVTITDAVFKIQLFDDNTAVIDFTELNKQIGIAEALDESKYTETSWNALEAALAAAKEARNATIQYKVDRAAKALADAIEALEEKPVIDYTELNKQIGIAEALDESKYTETSWNALETALAAAKEARNATTQAAVDTAAKALEDAIKALVEKTPVVVDYTELNKQIGIAEALDESKYTETSWNALETALAAAKEARNATTQAAVDTAAKALEDAIKALVEKTPVVVDYTELNKQIGIAEALDESKYTETSWNALKTALAAAKEARNATTQAAVDTAAKALENAIKALKLKAPVFVNGHGKPTISSSDKIAATKIDTTNKLMIIDTQVAGITVSQLKKLIKFQAENADSIEIVIGDGTLSGSDLVANGTKVTATAKRNGTSETDVVTYNIVILGDLNCNGRIESGDAVLISRMLVGEIQFNKVQKLAADTNCNNRTDIGDATIIASKIVDEENYQSMLGVANA